MKSPIQLFTAIAILLATATVAAQVYKWVDKDGKVQYSDVPPPPDASKAEAKKVADAPSGVAGTSAPAPARTLQDRAKESDKRRSDGAEKAKTDADAAKVAEENEQNCRAAKTALIDLESGRPVFRSDEKGERSYMSDEQRQAEIARARGITASTCKN